MGVLYEGWFANNHRGGDDGFNFPTLQPLFRTVEALPPPVDFPTIGTPHVRTFWCN